MPGVDRRYKLLKDGLPGASNFAVGDLSDGNLIEWDATTGKWIISPSIKATFQGAGLYGNDTTSVCVFNFHDVGDVNTARFFTNTTTFGLRSFVNGNAFDVRGNDAAGNLDVLFYADPDGGANLYYAGAVRLQTSAQGIIVSASTGDGNISFVDGDNEIGAVYKDEAGPFRMINREHGQPVQLYSENNSGVATLLLNGDPDNSTDLYYAGTATLRTYVVSSGIFLRGIDFGDSAFVVGQETSKGSLHLVSDAYVDAIIDGDNNATVNAFRIWKDSTDIDAATNVLAFAEDGSTIGNPTGGRKGHGTLNAQAVYDDNTLLTDYVFDAELEGTVDLAKWDEAVPNRKKQRRDPETGDVRDTEEVAQVRLHEPARDFSARMDDLDPKAYAAKWRAQRKLPAFIRDSQNGDRQLSVGEYAQRLLETCEVQAVHIDKLLQRIEALEARIPTPETIGTRGESNA